MIKAIVAGLLSGLLSPLVLSWLQHNIIWRRQKRYEVKYSIFTDAVRALSQYETDVLDFQLQQNKPQIGEIVKKIELRPETSSLIEKSRGLVMAFFSPETHDLFDKAFKATLSIENVPNIEFEESRNEAIISMTKELGIDNDSIFQRETAKTKKILAREWLVFVVSLFIPLFIGLAVNKFSISGVYNDLFITEDTKFENWAFVLSIYIIIQFIRSIYFSIKLLKSKP
jgi:hypothetical protein